MVQKVSLSAFLDQDPSVNKKEEALRNICEMMAKGIWIHKCERMTNTTRGRAADRAGYWMLNNRFVRDL